MSPGSESARESGSVPRADCPLARASDAGSWTRARAKGWRSRLAAFSESYQTMYGARSPSRYLVTSAKSMIRDRQLVTSTAFR